MLRRPTALVSKIDGAFAKVVDAMCETMYEAPGVGLAAPQVGIQQRFFVFDIGDGPAVLVNPVVISGEGEWVFEEGCLSLPGLSFEIVRSKLVTVQALDIDGNEVVIEGDEMLARVMLHEIDHLDGVLMLDRLEPAERKVAMKMLREQAFASSGSSASRQDHAL